MSVLAAGLVYAALASPPTYSTGWLFLGTGSALLVAASILWASISGTFEHAGANDWFICVSR